MTMRRYALGHFRIFESGRVHATAAQDTRGASVLLMVTEPRSAMVTLSGYGRGATCAEACKVARAELAPPVQRDDPPVIRQLELFAEGVNA